MLSDSPLDRVLSRLDRVRQSPTGWTAQCPSHSDRSPSLSVAEGDDGRVLLHDHAGCSADEIVRAIGLELRDLFPASDARASYRRPLPSPPYTLPRNIAEMLLESGAFGETWETAKLLAQLDPGIARRDVEASWDYLTDRLDVAAMLRVAYLIRGVALFRYANAGRAHEPKERARAVRRLLRDLEIWGDRSGPGGAGALPPKQPPQTASQRSEQHAGAIVRT